MTTTAETRNLADGDLCVRCGHKRYEHKDNCTYRTFTSYCICSSFVETATAD